MVENKILIGIKEAAKMVNLSLPTMYKLAYSDGFPSIRVGKRILINVEGLQRWANEQCGHNIN